MDREEQKLTMDFIRSLMEDSYTLVLGQLLGDQSKQEHDVLETCMEREKELR